MYTTRVRAACREGVNHVHEDLFRNAKLMYYDYEITALFG